MALNNEVSILNIANIDNDIKDASTRAMIAPEEKMDYATRVYDANQYFIWNDRKLYKTSERINAGTALVVDGNIKLIGDVASQLTELFTNGPENVKDYISNVEETDNASRAYDKGEYIIWRDGFLYRVIVDVSLGTLWQEGTNIERVDNLTSLINDLEDKTDQTRNNMIATIEPNNTASRHYIAGEQFVFDNVLCKATEEINKNDTIELSRNCIVVRNLSTQVSKLQRPAMDIEGSTVSVANGELYKTLAYAGAAEDGTYLAIGYVRSGIAASHLEYVSLSKTENSLSNQSWDCKYTTQFGGGVNIVKVVPMLKDEKLYVQTSNMSGETHDFFGQIFLIKIGENYQTTPYIQ